MTRRGKILILSHEQHPLEFSRYYLLHWMREQWMADGFEVEEVCGIRSRVEADLAFVHIDLTVVPPEYLEYARQYRRHVNASFSDIRKTTISRQRVSSGDRYDGPVIVKTELNSAAAAEKFAASVGLTGGEEYLGLPQGLTIEDKSGYRVYRSLSEVPSAFLESKALIIEKFLPEMHAGQYVLRHWYVCGDAAVDEARMSPQPIFSDGVAAPEILMKAPPELHELRRKLNIDYGRIEYVMRDGKPVVYDINKTAGVTPPDVPNAESEDRECGRVLARGIYSLFR